MLAKLRLYYLVWITGRMTNAHTCVIVYEFMYKMTVIITSDKGFGQFKEVGPNQRPFGHN